MDPELANRDASRMHNSCVRDSLLDSLACMSWLEYHVLKACRRIIMRESYAEHYRALLLLIG